MIPAEKRLLPCKWPEYVPEKSLGRYYRILSAEEIIVLLKKSIKEGVFVMMHGEPGKWYSVLPCDKIDERFVAFVLEDKRTYWWAKTTFGANKFLRSIYISVMHYKEVGRYGG